MSDIAYVRVAADLAHRIRSGYYQPGTQLPSLTKIAEAHEVSDIVVRKAIDLLELQNLVERVRRRGIFVAERPSMVRVSPERQMETAESTFQHESKKSVEVARERYELPANEELQATFRLSGNAAVTLTITRASEGGEPVSISDTYQPVGVEGISTATFLEETVCDRIPSSEHAAWLGSSPGELVKRVHQKFFTNELRVVMVSDISYPKSRYDAFVFRMALTDDLADEGRN